MRHADGSALTARELPDRTAAHGAGPATTCRLRCQVAAPTGRLLITGSGRYLPSYSWSPRFYHPAAAPWARLRQFYNTSLVVDQLIALRVLVVTAEPCWASPVFRNQSDFPVAESSCSRGLILARR